MTKSWHTSAFTGLFTRFGGMSPRPHDPACALASGEAPSWHSPGNVVLGSGIGWTIDAAENACVGEAIERLQSSPLPTDVHVAACFADWPLDEPAISPEAWTLFHADQYRQIGFPFQPFTPTTVCDWVRCRFAQSGLPCWIPAEFAYLDLPTPHRIAPGYSTGLAAGRTGDSILLRGLQEVVERDAVMGAHWGRYRVEEVSFSDVLSLLGDDVARRVVRPNLRYRFLRVVNPWSEHVTIVTLEGEDREGYCFSIGSCCREAREASWSKSLLEAIHGRHYARYLKGRIAAGAMKLGSMPRSFAEHAVWYSVHPRPLFDSTIAPLAESAGQETANDLIRRLGPDRPVLFRDMTPPALASEDLGWHVLRVVVPGLQPLHGHHAFAHLGGPLWSPRGLTDWRAMPPHPFP